ncbi:hypothetical protein [Paenibacillus sp. A3]|uniref:hypothetical protein n=1 Tax=Paenibacillus sp. A3 TaxID=1337054 RepID=UPI000AA36BE4|nr:hypothetical protein [Paenibacillus sp. A3]
MSQYKFPRQKDKKGGWTIDIKFLKRVESVMEQNGFAPTWEGIELVLLALEKLEGGGNV